MEQGAIPARGWQSDGEGLPQGRGRRAVGCHRAALLSQEGLPSLAPAARGA